MPSPENTEDSLRALATSAEENADHYSAADLDDEGRLALFFERHLALLADLPIGAASIYFAAQAEPSRRTRAQFDSRPFREAVAISVERVLAEYLAATRREPHGAGSLGELAALLVALLDGLAVNLRARAAIQAEELSMMATAALASWTALRTEVASDSDSAPSVEDRVRELDSALGRLDPDSTAALTHAVELMALAPRSTLAFWRARHHATAILAQPDICNSTLGARAWTHAAEMLSMADGNRPLAEDVARTTLARGPVDGDDPVALLRGAWLLLRLERFTEALEYIARFRFSGSAFGEYASTSDALEAYALSATGPMERAIALGRRAMGTTGLGAGLGAAVAIRVLTRSARREEAREMLTEAPSPRQPADMGATSLLIARGTLAAYTNQPIKALNDLNVARDHLRRVGSTNPAGWPWLEPTVRAMAHLGQSRQARAVIEQARAPAIRWNTPIVMAELHRAEAHVAEDLQDARRSLRAAAGELMHSEAHLEHHWVASELEATAMHRPALHATADEHAADPHGLTPRVAQVAQLVTDGLTDREIAAALHLSARTVSRHVGVALRATGAPNRTALARIMDRRR